jgi:hypothetical protein
MLAEKEKKIKSRAEIVDYVVICIAIISFWMLVKPKFPTNDDYGLMSILAGYKSGTPVAVPFYCEYLYSLLISGSYRITGRIPWYIIVLMTLMIVNCLCLFYAIKKMVLDAPIKKYKGIIYRLIFISLLLAFYFFNLVYITYSIVPAVCGSSIILLILTTKNEDVPFIKNTITGIIFVLFFFAWNIRRQTGYVVLVSVMFAIIFAYFSNIIKIRRCLFWTMSVIAIAILSVYADWYSGTGNGWNEFALFYDACGQYTDYTHLTYEEAPVLYQSLGWDENLYALVNKWFFMDEKVDLNSFNILNQSVDNQTFYGYSSRRALIAGMFGILKASSTWIKFFLMLWLITVLIVAIFKLSSKYDSKSELKDVVGAIVFLFIGYTFISYLLMRGRFLDRAVYPVFFCTMIPSLVICLRIVLNISAKARNRQDVINPKKIIVISHLFIFIVFIIAALGGVSTANWNKYNPESSNIKKKLEQYVIDNDEFFYISDVSLTMSGDPFTVYPNHKPTNYTFWGGTFLKSPLYYEQIKEYGFDDFSKSDFVKNNVRFISLTGPNDIFLDYMREEYPDCRVEITDQASGFIIFRYLEK